MVFFRLATPTATPPVHTACNLKFPSPLIFPQPINYTGSTFRLQRQRHYSGSHTSGNSDKEIACKPFWWFINHWAASRMGGHACMNSICTEKESKRAYDIIHWYYWYSIFEQPSSKVCTSNVPLVGCIFDYWVQREVI
jgi:hypothetical protein